MRKVAIAAAVSAATALGALAPAPAMAWNDQGHMATGDIAYDALAAHDPKAVAAIVAIMRDHPDHALFEKRLAGLSGKARERRLFALMAVWPDDTRRSQYDRPEWHYAVKVVSPWRFVVPFTFGQADRAFREQLAKARDTKAPRAERAIALCWIMHLVGDQHQPLHAGHWMSWTFPKTDRAGTLAYVRRQAGGAPTDMHDLWDAAPNRPAASREAGADAAAAAIEAAHPRPARSDLGPNPSASLSAWERESWTLAKTVAYRDGKLATTSVKAQAPVLPPGYVTKMNSIADTRIAQAGYRLADVLALVRS
jgi:hypothetical protein